MSKRTIFTNITPLPATVTRDIALSLLHDHQSMIQLNPLVIEHHKCKPPKNASADEYNCTWYSLTDKISYLPGGMAKGHVTYNCCFHDLPMGIQTHCYAPMGLEIKEKWSVGGNMPGEPREIQELGLKGIPKEGLYIREDCDMVCNMLMTTYVKKTLKKAHSVLVERLLANGEHIEDKQYRQSMGSFLNRQSTVPSIASYETSDTRTISDHGSEPPSSPPAYMAHMAPTSSSSNPYLPPHLTPGQFSQSFHQVPPMRHGSPIPSGYHYSPQLRAGQYQQYPPTMPPGQGLPYPISDKYPRQSPDPPQIAELASSPVTTAVPAKHFAHELPSPMPSPAIPQGSFADQKAAQGIQSQGRYNAYSPNGADPYAPPPQDGHQTKGGR